MKPGVIFEVSGCGDGKSNGVDTNIYDVSKFSLVDTQNSRKFYPYFYAINCMHWDNFYTNNLWFKSINNRKLQYYFISYIIKLFCNINSYNFSIPNCPFLKTLFIPDVPFTPENNNGEYWDDKYQLYSDLYNSMSYSDQFISMIKYVNNVIWAYYIDINTNKLIRKKFTWVNNIKCDSDKVKSFTTFNLHAMSVYEKTASYNVYGEISSSHRIQINKKA